MLRTVSRAIAMTKGTVKISYQGSSAAVQSVVPKVHGRMFSVQNLLPRLPVPPLQQTLNKYLKTLKPLLPDDEYQQTKKICEQFADGEGPGLQALLEQRARKTTSWLSDWWLHVAYLDYRMPVVIHSSPGIVMPTQDFLGEDDQVRFAAKLISGILDYKEMVDEQTLPIEMLGGKPLCMDQYFKIFSSCRIPGVKTDSVVCYPPDQANPPRHIIIIHRNHFFSMHVYGKNGKPLNESQIKEQLVTIMEQSEYPATNAIGILTTENRNEWGKIYKKLVKDKTNKLSLERIARSIFVLCLDQPVPHTSPELRFSALANQMLHGGGGSLNSGNRWFDKTLQFIVGIDGAVGINYEHSAAEGPPIASLLDHASNFVSKDNPKPLLPAPGITEPERLQFNISSDLASSTQEAEKRFDMLVNDLDLTAFHFNKFGKDFPKAQKFSPDGFIQVAIQLAYYKLYKQPCATYESGSTRRFQLGRTETIRSSSVDSLKFSETMVDEASSDQEKVALLRKAVNAHRQYTNESINGEGVDRHLLGLKLSAVENGMNVPKIFMDPAYGMSCHWKLSTSQVPAKTEAILCFGPVAPDGYGVCYNPQNSQILFAISAFNSSPDTNSKKLVASLEESLSDMKALLERTPQAKL